MNTSVWKIYIIIKFLYLLNLLYSNVEIKYFFINNFWKEEGPSLPNVEQSVNKFKHSKHEPNPILVSSLKIEQKNISKNYEKTF